ncbi:MAG: aspartate kinase [Pseudomonadota bacterium]
MARIVQKYGGTSVGSVELISKVADRVARLFHAGNQVAVVLSAMGSETDELVAMAHEAAAEPDPREYDVLLAAGEQKSIALLAMALMDRGVPARSYLGPQVSIQTEARHGTARILNVQCGQLEADLKKGCVPVVAGFQGVDDRGNITTLGRGGSDTTAVALAVALDAAECQILSDVDGVFTTDPRMVPNAQLMRRVTFEEILEMASLGSRVLQIRAVEFAGKHNLPLRVLPAHADGEGTLITYEEPDMEAPLVSGIAFNRDEAEITLMNVPDRPGIAHRILAPIAEHDVEVDMIVLNAPKDGRVDFSFTVHRSNYDRACELASQATDGLDGVAVIGNSQVVKISVVGVGMRSHAGIATRMFEALAGEGINVRMVATSEIKISVLVDERYLELGVRTLHEAFRLDVTRQ